MFITKAYTLNLPQRLQLRRKSLPEFTSLQYTYMAGIWRISIHIRHTSSITYTDAVRSNHKFNWRAAELTPDDTPSYRLKRLAENDGSIWDEIPTDVSMHYGQNWLFVALYKFSAIYSQ